MSIFPYLITGVLQQAPLFPMTDPELCMDTDIYVHIMSKKRFNVHLYSFKIFQYIFI